MTEQADKTLVVLIDGRRAGVITEDQTGRLDFTYDPAWRADRDATPLSLSMPLASRSHGDPVIRAFLWGLLPDSEQVLDRWARTFHVSARNPFALLRHVGEDCAGAVQFTAPDRAEALLAGNGGIDPLDDTEIAERLRILRKDPAAWHMAKTGQFSLAGAQAKTALHYDAETQRWGAPWGAVPTTHILKPAVTGLDDHDLNEHLCLETARAVGLRVATSKVVSFGDERAVVVERYDRARASDGRVRRVHQEDACQALAVPPTRKYQNEGGPAPEQIVALLRQEIRPAVVASESVSSFVDALAFNWIVGGTDAHAKNYSVLLSGGRVRLAPLYDIASALPYDDMYLPKLRMAMRIHDEYRLEWIRSRHWQRLAEHLDLDPDAVIARVDDLAARVPGALAASVSAEAVRALDSHLPALLLDRVAARAHECRARLATG